MQSIIRFFRHPIFRDYRFIFGVFALISLLVSLREALFTPTVDNYLAFKHSFFHLIEHKNLYVPYPDEYKTYYNYGPLFATLMGIWAYLPIPIAVVLWNYWHLFNYCAAIYFLPLSKEQRVFLYWFCLQELITSLINVQTNPTITGIMLGLFILLERKQLFWAAGILMFGLFFKIYAVIAGALCIFYPHKIKFGLYCLVWAAFFFVVPMLFISWQELLFLYGEWGKQLSLHSKRESMTVMGMLNGFVGYELPKHVIMAIGVLLTVSIFYKALWQTTQNFRFRYLSALLIFAVIFNPGSESPTYIIAVSGVALWYTVSPYAPWRLGVLVGVFIFTCLYPTDIVPIALREAYLDHIQFKAIPCIIAWCIIMYELYTDNAAQDKAAVTQ